MTALASGRPEDGEAGNMISMKIKGGRIKCNLAQPVSNMKEGQRKVSVQTAGCASMWVIISSF